MESHRTQGWIASHCLPSYILGMVGIPHTWTSLYALGMRSVCTIFCQRDQASKDTIIPLTKCKKSATISHRQYNRGRYGQETPVNFRSGFQVQHRRKVHQAPRAHSLAEGSAMPAL